MSWGEADWGVLVWGPGVVQIPALSDGSLALGAVLLLLAGVFGYTRRRARRAGRFG